MKIVLAGGRGLLGRILVRELAQPGNEIVVLSRHGSDDGNVVAWDGRTLGPWVDEINGADVVVNLAGRSVNCRYNPSHLMEMMDSRVWSTRAVGQAIERAARPPRVWLQMSTATIYAHRFDGPNDEATGRIGGHQPNVPALWSKSIDIARAWEATLGDANTPRTRKVALRTAIVMSPDRGGAFDVLLGLVRRGLGGPIAGGRQYVSWIHDCDFAGAVRFLIDCDDLSGPVNLAAPAPLPQAEFMAALRRAWGARVGLLTPRWMAEVGAIVLRTETELILKSRRVVPGRLLAAGFSFAFPEWPATAAELVAQWRRGDSAG